MKRNMQATHEIVRVVDPAFLVNAAKRACRYETEDGRRLAPGYYFALWRGKVAVRSYGPDVRYFGPFATEREALLVRDCAAFLGIVWTPAVAASDAPPNDEGLLTPAVRAAYAGLLQTAQQALGSYSS